jgi:hypothetical protein
MSSSAQDVVGVFDDNLNQLFADARSIRATVTERSKIMEHPVESGATISDHVVDHPTEIELSVVLTPATYPDTYQQIKTTWLAKTTVTVVTKTDTYDNQLIFEIPHDETPEMFNTVAVAIKLRQVIMVDAQYAQLPASSVKKSSNASTVKTGQKNPAPATPSQNSAAYDLIFGSGS